MIKIIYSDGTYRYRASKRDFLKWLREREGHALYAAVRRSHRESQRRERACR